MPLVRICIFPLRRMVSGSIRPITWIWMAEGRWVRITPGFLLTMAVMFWLDEGVGLLGWGVLACVVHELGHLLVGAALGGRPRWLSLSAVGLELNMEYPAGLSYGRELAVALAGPAVNLVTGGICAQFGNYLLAGVSFGLGLFNLMPVLPLDGGRALWCVLSALFGAQTGERAADGAAGVLVGLLAGIGAAAAVSYANFTLLLAAVWLFGLTLLRKREKI